ncbi:LuxR C-terminal-related transcriptional regulator [Fulvimarina sp. 2208YS6-2-32]|uniref:LuxR C-terminal-related transcriptional regulator n=1 Tax=Fulvimarina uroteuthidis TaxID=3098149 RepID=A0ABU5I530_9HYPH|nr:LuxR C-terminal-related transcriptional regulator [Fulvimarina sp. 2208YS6-2-32]MDY8110505.1 LuxR C-terminal-related transcriptional regulator [Fulvimarina sp. 2208YS6-2-32]
MLPDLASLPTPWTEHGLRDALASAAVAAGFTHVAALSLPATDEQGLQTRYLIGNWSAAFRRSYEQADLHKHKVVASMLTADPMPFEWDIDTLYGISDPQPSPGARLLAGAGWSEGVFLPVHGLTAFSGALCFAGPEPLPPRPAIRALHSFAFAFFGMLSAVRFEENRRNNPLSARERDCLRLAMLGKTSSEIGTVLSLSEYTISQYLTAAQRKLDASNRTHAVALAAQLGYLS